MKTYGEKKYQSQNEKSDITQSMTYLARYKQVLDFLVTVGGISITSSTSSSSDPLQYGEVAMGIWTQDYFIFKKEIYLEYLDTDKMRGKSI